MEKDQKKKHVFRLNTFILLLSLPLLGFGLDFSVFGQRISLSKHFFGGKTAVKKTVDEKEFIKFHVSRLVRGMYLPTPFTTSLFFMLFFKKNYSVLKQGRIVRNLMRRASPATRQSIPSTAYPLNP